MAYWCVRSGVGECNGCGECRRYGVQPSEDLLEFEKKGFRAECPEFPMIEYDEEKGGMQYYVYVAV